MATPVPDLIAYVRQLEIQLTEARAALLRACDWFQHPNGGWSHQGGHETTSLDTDAAYKVCLWELENNWTPPK